MSLTASETDLWTQQASTAQTVGKFLPQKLLRLSEWVAARSQLVTSEFSCATENKGVSHKENNDGTKASTTNRSHRKLSKDKSSNKTNSTVSGQDTRSTRFRRGSDKE